MAKAALKIDPAISDLVFSYRSKDALASGRVLLDGSFTVFAGSTAINESEASDKRDREVRDTLMSQGVLEQTSDPNILRFAKDYTFSSASRAAGVIRDGNVSGPQSWVERGSGMSLKDYREGEPAFAPLNVEIPDYVKPDGSPASAPFSKSSHSLFTRQMLGSEGAGDGPRTDYFKRNLVRIFDEIGRVPVPYRFLDSRGAKRSMDGGCLKFVGPDGQDVADFVYNKDGFIVAVRPKPSLVTRYSAQEAISVAAEVPRSVASLVRPVELGGGDDSIAEPRQAPALTANLPFDLEEVVDERRKQESLRVIREGGAAFRKAVLSKWRRCAVTRSKTRQVLEAAHLYRYLGPKTNDIRNAIALRADIHVLFDKHLIGLKPVEDGVVVVLAESLAGSEYASLGDRTITFPPDSSSRPDPTILKHRFEQFQIAEQKRTSA